METIQALAKIQQDFRSLENRQKFKELYLSWETVNLLKTSYQNKHVLVKLLSTAQIRQCLINNLLNNIDNLSFYQEQSSLLIALYERRIYD